LADAWGIPSKILLTDCLIAAGLPLKKQPGAEDKNPYRETLGNFLERSR
jgi:hypothetical protein